VRSMDERLETPKELAARIGLSERKIRHLIQTRQLEPVMIGCRGAFARLVEAKKVMPCQEEIRVPVASPPEPMMMWAISKRVISQ
jgi:hypothetical protein